MRTILLFFLIIGLSLSYDRKAAVEYAKKYWKDYNKDYINYADIGGDCANFVSQCMIAGGFNFYGCSVTLRDSKASLPRVKDIYTCLLQKGWHHSKTLPPSFKAGYPVFLDDLSHIMIASSVNEGKVKISGHTNDRWEYEVPAPLIYFYP